MQFEYIGANTSLAERAFCQLPSRIATGLMFPILDFPRFQCLSNSYLIK
jgi:hypothetical protein